MKDGALGKDGVRTTYIRRADERTQNMLIEPVHQLYDTSPLEREASGDIAVQEKTKEQPQ